jgi:hypothetical protein
MVIENPALCTEVARELRPHASHKITLAVYGDTIASDWIVVECQDCQRLLVEFVPAVVVSQDPGKVHYEGHYDEIRDVCYVEVFKAGKAPYPLQERQDVVNHSPAGISWGYNGSGPAQCAFAILLDYLGDEQAARSQYQEFKFRVIAALPRNTDWTLNGRDIESALRSGTLR